MATTLLLVRHGETKWNKLGRFQGSQDIELSDEGIFQAQFLRTKLENSFDYIYTSPLKRAVDTAKVICSNTDKKLELEPALREIDFGEWEGLTITEIKESYPDSFKIWRDDKIDAPLCGGDLSIRLASIRAKDGILNLVNKHKNRTIIIVCHGGIIKASLIALFDWNMSMYHKMNLGNTSICKISFDDELSPRIVTLNDTSHLPKDYKIRSYV